MGAGAWMPAPELLTSAPAAVIQTTRNRLHCLVYECFRTIP